MSEVIYCDESGFSGNFLSDDGSPYFVYAGVRMVPEEAASFVAEMKSTYRIQGEMKGANLTKHLNGRKAVAAVLERCAPHAKVVIADKKFALAGKLFEYIFEPCFSHNEFFYKVGFHVFLANILDAAWTAQPETAGALLKAFQESMRNMDPKHLEALASTFGASGDPNSPQSLAFRFAQANKEVIRAEMQDRGMDNPVSRWSLDLSATALDGILASWGETMGPMTVVCDSSKPLQDLQEPFNWRVGYSGPKQYLEIGSRKKLVTYALRETIAFGKSQDYPGLQLADVIASSISYALRHREDSEANSWLQTIDSAHAVEETIAPNPALANVTHLDAQLNSLLLIELVRRAEAGEALLPGIEVLYARARKELPKMNDAI